MKKLFIITGEHSGDLHAATVVQELKKTMPDLEIEGIGGTHMANAGVKIFKDHSKMGVVGLSLKAIFDHIKLGKEMKKQKKFRFWIFPLANISCHPLCIIFLWTVQEMKLFWRLLVKNSREGYRYI